MEPVPPERPEPDIRSGEARPFHLWLGLLSIAPGSIQYLTLLFTTVRSCIYTHNSKLAWTANPTHHVSLIDAGRSRALRSRLCVSPVKMAGAARYDPSLDIDSGDLSVPSSLGSPQYGTLLPSRAPPRAHRRDISSPSPSRRSYTPSSVHEQTRASTSSPETSVNDDDTNSQAGPSRSNSARPPSPSPLSGPDMGPPTLSSRLSGSGVHRSRSLNTHKTLPSLNTHTSARSPLSATDRLGYTRRPGDPRPPPLITPTVGGRMERWIKEIVVCNFDLERGPVVERRILGRRWGPGEKENVSVSCVLWSLMCDKEDVDGGTARFRASQIRRSSQKAQSCFPSRSAIYLQTRQRYVYRNRHPRCQTRSIPSSNRWLRPAFRLPGPHRQARCSLQGLTGPSPLRHPTGMDLVQKLRSIGNGMNGDENGSMGMFGLNSARMVV